MIDLFSLALSHGLMMIAAWRLLWRTDLDRDPPRVAENARAKPGA